MEQNKRLEKTFCFSSLLLLPAACKFTESNRGNSTELLNRLIPSLLQILIHNKG